MFVKFVFSVEVYCSLVVSSTSSFPWPAFGKSAEESEVSWSTAGARTLLRPGMSRELFLLRAPVGHRQNDWGLFEAWAVSWKGGPGPRGRVEY